MNQNSPQFDAPPPYIPREQYTPPPPKRGAPRFVKVVAWIVGSCLAGMLVIGVATSLKIDGAIDAGDSAPHVAPPKAVPGPAVPTPKTKTVEKAPVNNLPRDGVLMVPADLKPGTYRATAPEDNIVCYWARLRDTDGELGSIIANHTAAGGDLVTITVKPTDHAVEIQCTDAVWRRVS